MRTAIFGSPARQGLIIRGGHNIDPAEIEEALAGHEAVAFVGAIGQPDAIAGGLPCAYVELIEDRRPKAEQTVTPSGRTCRSPQTCGNLGRAAKDRRGQGVQT